MRSRLLDLAVATVCVACVCAPALPAVFAAAPLVESGGTVDQRVLQTGWISNPLDGTFESGRSGTQDGSIAWSQYTSGRKGSKLLLSSVADPAMKDTDNNVEIPDYGSTPGAWSVSGSDRRFGFTVLGTLGLSRFGDGTKWRGFDGTRSVEVARRGAAFSSTRTTIKLRAEFSSALASDAKPSAEIYATAVPNL